VPRIQLQAPHDAQQQILDQAKRFNVVALGRRAGKSTLAQHLLVESAIRGNPVGYLAPTYKLLSEFWRELRATLEPVTRSKSEQDHRLELISGGVVECWSLDDPDPARGRKYALLVVDEAAMVRQLMDVWQLALRATLADLQGSAWFMSTPRGLNDFWQLYLSGLDPLEQSWACWRMPTSVNPFIPAEEIESAQREMPERAFAQEFLAEFLSLEGAGVFRGVGAVSRLEPQPPERGHQYVIGVDWGRVNDFTVFSVIDTSVMAQVALDRFTEIDYDFQTERLHEWSELYHPRGLVVETNNMGGPLVERLQRGYARLVGRPRPALPILPWTATNASKAAVINGLSLAIENGHLTLLDDQTQKGELLAYEATRLPSGLLRYGAPEGGHDDTVVALALAYQGATSSQPTSRSSYAFRNGKH